VGSGCGAAGKLKELNADLEETLTQIRGVPMVPISGLTGHGWRGSWRP
jgi:hypothetical protein